MQHTINQEKEKQSPTLKLPYSLKKIN